MTPEEIKLLKDFNRNVEWLKNREMAHKCTASAAEVMKITGWTKDRLRGERTRGTLKSKKINMKYRYDISSLPEIHLTISTNQQPHSPLERA